MIQNNRNKKIYLDNAATSWPKPPQMLEAVQHFSDAIGANPGRAGHQKAVDSARIVYDTRQQLADLFSCSDPLHVIFSNNVTTSINLALFGLLADGDHVITTSMEHNAVMRPLRHLQTKGIGLSIAGCSSQGVLDPADIKKEIRPNTKMIAMLHASNVTGIINPITEIGRIAREHGLLFLVDAAQTAGSYPINMIDDSIDLLAFTGHKSLYGPMGTGGMVVGERVNIENFHPLIRGGTGSNSNSEQQPAFLPDKFESGTLNVFGLAGLNASLNWIKNIGVEKIHDHEIALLHQLADGLSQISRVRLYGFHPGDKRTAVLSFTINGLDNGMAGELLDNRYGILCRIGLHCAPSALKTLGTFPEGTIRFSPGYFNQVDEIEYVIKAVEELAKGIS